jgi:hypothetical protein
LRFLEFGSAEQVITGDEDGSATICSIAWLRSEQRIYVHDTFLSRGDYILD